MTNKETVIKKYPTANCKKVVDEEGDMVCFIRSKEHYALSKTYLTEEEAWKDAAESIPKYDSHTWAK